MTTTKCNTKTKANTEPFTEFLDNFGDVRVKSSDKAGSLRANITNIKKLSKDSLNVTETVLLGLKSMGRLISIAADNTEQEIPRGTLVDTGNFIELAADAGHSASEIHKQTDSVVKQNSRVVGINAGSVFKR